MKIRAIQACAWAVALLLAIPFASAQSPAKYVTNDYHIDSADPGVKLFVRQKTAKGDVRATDDNIVLFIHGATFPSTPDFDLQYKDYS